MGSVNKRQEMRLKRKKRIRKKITGTPDCPRLNVFRSARHIYAQVIDDTKGVTVAAASTVEKEIREAAGLAEKSKKERAAVVGKLVGQRARENGITRVVFDRGGFLYHGRVKAVSEGAREAGLQF